ncbi:MAG: glycosyltransferase, partial [Mycobacteriales bacterium]
SVSVRRWYGFHRMQRRVARRLDHLITVSEAAAADIESDFGVPAARLQVIPVGVDTELFRPGSTPRVPGRLVAMASADVVQTGQRSLLEALALLKRRASPPHLVLVGRPRPGGPTERLVAALGVGDVVEIKSGLEEAELAGLLASAQLAVVPSLYEGFSLPAIEALACGTALVASRAGALPEVVGDCARLVPPGDAQALAGAIAALLDDPTGREELGAAGRERVSKRYSWRSIAEATAEVYHLAIAGC